MPFAFKGSIFIFLIAGCTLNDVFHSKLLTYIKHIIALIRLCKIKNDI